MGVINLLHDILGVDSYLLHGTVIGILRKYKFVPFKLQPGQALLVERRLVSCHLYVNYFVTLFNDLQFLSVRLLNNEIYKQTYDNVEALETPIRKKPNQGDGKKNLKA